MIKKKITPKRYFQLLDDDCPKCGYKLAIWVNHNRNEKFVGCSNFPSCKYTESKWLLFEVIRDELDIPLTWRPNFVRELEAIMRLCESHKEKQYLLGAVYYIDSTDNDKSKGTWLENSKVIYQDISYDGLIFKRIYESWDMSGMYSPTSLAIIPQLKFGNKLHHDFGVFCSGEKSPNENEWKFEVAVEIDYHPSHEWNPGMDKFRDSLVNYKVIRIHPEDEPTKWFSKVKNEIGGKIFDQMN